MEHVIFEYNGVYIVLSLLNYEPFVPTCLTCLRALRAYVPLNFTCRRAFVPTCLNTLNYVPTCPLFLRAYAP